MTRQMFSSYKAQEKARQAKKAGGKAAPAAGAKPGRKHREASAEPAAAPARAASPSTASDHEMIDDLTAVKHLVQKLGADQVRKIVGLFE